MLGLRVDSDPYFSSLNKNAQQFKKSSRFANNLSGRFFVSGISGGFEKHKKLLATIKDQETKNENAENQGVLKTKRILYNHQPVLERHQREEMRKDAVRLLELEEKLLEIQRVKEAKRLRDRERRRRKLEYVSAAAIQKVFRGFIVRKRSQSVSIISNFLRAIAANQAILRFTSAMKSLKTFLKRKYPIWKRKNHLRKIARVVATENWSIVAEVACLWTDARRIVARDFVDAAIAVGSHLALESLPQADPRSLPKKKEKKVKKKTVQQKEFLQFFLTEFDRAEDKVSSDESEDTEESDDENGNVHAGRSIIELEADLREFKQLTSDFRQFSQHNPNLQQSSRYLKSLVSKQQSSGLERKKIYDLNDDRIQKIFQKHQLILLKMEKEERRRTTMLESAKTKEKEKDFDERHRKEFISKKDKIKDFQKKLDEENSKRARFQAKLREIKQQREEEEKRRSDELLLMAKEDSLPLIKRDSSKLGPSRPPSMGKLVPKKTALKEVGVPQITKTKRPPVPRFPHAQKAEDSAVDEEHQKKKELSAEEKEHYKELLSKRIKQAKILKDESQKALEHERHEKKEKLAKFLSQYQSQLAEMKAKKQEAKRKQKLEKTMSENEIVTAQEGLQHVISSAPEEFTNLIDDFEFEDFMGKPLMELFHEDPDQHCDEVDDQRNSREGNEPSFDVDPTPAPVQIPPNQSPDTKPASLPGKKSYKINRAVLKLPKNLKETPYFKHYVKFMKQKNVPVTEILENNEKKAHKRQKEKKVNPVSSFSLEEALVAPLNPPADGESEEREDELDDQESDGDHAGSLLALIQRAQEKKFGPSNDKKDPPSNSGNGPVDSPLPPLETSLSSKNLPLLLIPKLAPQPTIPSLNSLLSSQHHAPPQLPKMGPTPSSIPVPPLESIVNIKNRYGIAVDELLPQSLFSNLHSGVPSNHLGVMKSLKMKKLKKDSKAGPEGFTAKEKPSKKSKASQMKMSKGERHKSLPTGSFPNPKESSPSESSPTTLVGDDTRTDANDSLAYSPGALSVAISKPARRLSQRYQETTPATDSRPQQFDSFLAAEGKRKEDGTAETRVSSAERNKIKQKIDGLHDYEQQLVKDYQQLKSQFNQKLQLFQESNPQTLPRRSQDLSAVGEAPSAATLPRNKPGDEGEVRKSVTQSYLEQQPKVSTKDLLMEWAIEDAIENGEITDQEVVQMYEDKQQKYRQPEGDEDGNRSDYDAEENEGDYGDEEEVEYEEEDQANEVNYDEDSYYDRRLFESTNKEVPGGLSVRVAEEDAEEDYDSDEEEYFRRERDDRSKVQLAAQLDDTFCLDLLHNLSSKMKKKD